VRVSPRHFRRTVSLALPRSGYARATQRRSPRARLPHRKRAFVAARGTSLVDRHRHIFVLPGDDFPRTRDRPAPASQNPPIGPLASESATPGIDRLWGCPKTVRQRARPQCRGWREGLFHHSGSARPLSTTNLTSQAFVRCHTRQTIPHIRNRYVCSALKHTRWAALFKTDQPIHIRYIVPRALPPESPLRS